MMISLLFAYAVWCGLVHHRMKLAALKRHLHKYFNKIVRISFNWKSIESSNLDEFRAIISENVVHYSVWYASKINGAVILSLIDFEMCNFIGCSLLVESNWYNGIFELEQHSDDDAN